MASIISAGTTSGTSLNLSGDTSGVLQLATNGSTTAITVDTSQNVGIGTASPSNLLHVSQASSDFQARITGTSAANAGSIRTYNAGGEATGLGTTGSTNTGYGANLGFMGTITNIPQIFLTNNTERMRIDSSGNVGIGTSSPGVKLDVVGGTIRSVVSGGTPIVYLNNGTTQHSISNNSGVLAFQNDGTNQANITSTGLLQFNSGYGSVATAYGCRAWVTFNGTGTPAIRASGNVSSIVDYGTGDYGVLFSTSMPDGNYSLVGAAVKTGGGPSGTNSAVVTMGESPSTAGTGVGVLTVDGTPVDRAYVYAAFFR